MRSARTSAALQFLTVGVALGLISSAVVASIEVGKSEAVEFAPDVAGPPSSRPLGTAPGQQSQEEADLGDGIFLAAWQLKDGAKEFHLEATAVDSGTELAFNGHRPGPTIRVNEGDRVRITVTNHTGAPADVHWHGMAPPDFLDGTLQPELEPEQSWTFEYTALSPGIHWYHGHSVGELGGLDGVLEVVPLPGWTRRLALAGRPTAVHTKAGSR